MTNLLPRRPVVLCTASVLPTDIRQYTAALADAGLLRVFVGGIAYHNGSFVGSGIKCVDRWFRTRIYAGSESRRIDGEFPSSCLAIMPWTEAASRLAVKLRLCQPGPLLYDRINQSIDRRAAELVSPSDRLVIGREDGCLYTFRAAKHIGALSLYDLPIPFHTVLHRELAVETKRYPVAAAQFYSSDEARQSRRVRKTCELIAADHVLVASQFVKLGAVEAGKPPESVTVIPYGCDVGRDYYSYSQRKPILLYVGHLSLRKGTLRLLHAWKRLGAHRTHTLRLIGKRMLPPAALDEFAGLYEYIPAVPRSQLWQHYATAQAFVFPSACDGFGLVINEALSCGTPIIASSNTGAPGYIAEGVQGFTYQHGDDDRLAAHIDWMLSNPARVAEMSRAAYEFAQSWGWPQYRAAVRELVLRLLSGTTTSSVSNVPRA